MEERVRFYEKGEFEEVLNISIRTMSRRLHRMNKIDILHMFNHQKQFSPAEFKMIIKLLADDINLNPSEPDGNGGGVNESYVMC